MIAGRSEIKRRFDEQRGDDEIELSVDVDLDDFYHTVIPYTVGYMGDTHGLVEVDYGEQTMWFKRVVDDG